MKESTLIIIKPNVAMNSHVGTIMREIQSLGYEILNKREDRPCESFFLEFYGEHIGKGWFPELLDYMTEGHIVAIEASGTNAVARWRKDIIGFRDKYGEGIVKNGFHGSDSKENALREIEMFFG
jgi:nucleoside-diphosphate kinase